MTAIIPRDAREQQLMEHFIKTDLDRTVAVTPIGKTMYIAFTGYAGDGRFGVMVIPSVKAWPFNISTDLDRPHVCGHVWITERQGGRLHTWGRLDKRTATPGVTLDFIEFGDGVAPGVTWPAREVAR